MRFLHVSDIHLGKRLLGVSLAEDISHVLKQVLSYLTEYKCDAIFLAGDLYDKQYPTPEAVAMADEFLSNAAALGVSVFAIAGNHDSAERVAYGARLLGACGVHLSPVFNGSAERCVFCDEYGEVDVYLLPFIKPVVVKKFYPEESIPDYEAAVKLALSNVKPTPMRRSILLAHQYVNGSTVGESEELSVGGLDAVGATAFDGFDYVALGHLHIAQNVGDNANMRYSGSPIAYSLSEAAVAKSVVLGELKAKGDLSLTLLPLSPLHNMREVRGALSQLSAMPFSEDYIYAVVTDEIVPPDAAATLSLTFPNLLRFSVQNSKTGTAVIDIPVESPTERNSADLFRDFYMLQNNNTPPSEEQMEIVRKLFDGIGGLV